MRPLREVPNVLCHDHFATPDIRRRQHVAVLTIWQFKGRDQRVIAGHKQSRVFASIRLSVLSKGGTTTMRFVTQQRL